MLHEDKKSVRGASCASFVLALLIGFGFALLAVQMPQIRSEGGKKVSLGNFPTSMAGIQPARAALLGFGRTVSPSYRPGGASTVPRAEAPEGYDRWKQYR